MFLLQKLAGAFLIFFLVIFGLMPTGMASVALAAEMLANAGFARGGVLFSKYPFFAGDRIRIYTVIFNGSAEDLAGRVEFYDNGGLLGGVDFTAKGGGTVRDVRMDWMATSGDHNIAAKIVDAKVSAAGARPRAVALDAMESGAARVVVDSDTDRDGIGDKADLDIDGDGISNDEELKFDLNVYKNDTNGDGVGDKSEYDLMVARLAETKPVVSQIAAAEEKVRAIVGTTTIGIISAAAHGTADVVESARQSAQKWAEQKSAALKSELASAQSDIGGDPSKIKTSGVAKYLPERPFAHVNQLAAAALGFALSSKWLIYFLLAFIVYVVLKMLYKLMR